MEQPAAHGQLVGRPLLAGMLAVVVLAAAAGAVGWGPAPGPGPHPEVFAFLSGPARTELAHLRRYGPRINVIAPDWYELRLNDLRLTGGPTPQITALARRTGVQLWPVVNATVARGDVLDAAARRWIVTAIAAEAAARSYAGMTLDVEPLPLHLSAAYSELVRALVGRLHAQGEHLAVYVPRRTAGGGDAAYDWRALAANSDLLIASGYDEHSAASHPGPVTTAAGFAQMLDYAAAISRRRIAPAIGSFGYIWPATGGRGRLISSLAAGRLRRQSGARLQGAGGDAFFRVNGRVVHYQSARALDARARDAQAAGMRWLALFSLGREPDAFWSHLTTARQAARRLLRG